MFADNTADPTSTAFDANASSLFARSGTNQIYKKFDSGSSTNWKLLDQPVPFVEIDPLGDIDSMPDTTPLSNTGGTLSLSTTGSEVGLGFQSIKFVSTAASQVVERDAITLPNGFQDHGSMGVKMLVKNNADWTLKLISSAGDVLEETVNTGNDWKILEFNGPMEIGSTTIKWEFTSSAADTLLISKASITPDVSLLSKELTNYHTLERLTTGSGLTSTASGAVRWGTLTEGGNASLLTYDDSNGTITAKVDCRVNIKASLVSTSGSTNWIIKNTTGAATTANTLSQFGQAAGRELPLSANVELLAGDFFYVNGNGTRDSSATHTLTVLAEATTPNIVTNSDNVASAKVSINSTSSIPNLSDIFIGFGTTDYDDDGHFVNVGSTNNATYTSTTYWECKKAGKYTVNSQLYMTDANVDADEQFIIAVTVNGTARSIKPQELTGSLGTSTRMPVTIATTLNLVKGDRVSIRFRHESGAAIDLNGATDHSWFQVVREDKSPIIGLEKRVAYLRDEKSSGTNGGGSTGGSFVTRELNVLDGDTSFITLSSNQFVLQPGKYAIYASAPTYEVRRHKIRLRNITDSTTDLVGTSEYTSNVDSSHTVSLIYGTINIADAKTYEIQHYCQDTNASIGFGLASSSGEVEVYTQVTVEKLK